MKKVKLQAAYSFDFHILGIICSQKDFTVSWAIGEALGIQMKRGKDLPFNVNGEKGIVGRHVFENNLIRYSLVSNKILNSHGHLIRHLAPSLGHFDFLLKIEELEKIDSIEATFVKLRNAPRIDSIAKLDVLNIKEKESLLF